MSQAKERIYFTVSMWNRFAHLQLLINDLGKIAEVDNNIALHVCAFQGKDAQMGELKQVIHNAPCESCLTFRTDEFGNGLGHNVATAGVPDEGIVCHIAVDICMPPNITQRIRRNVVRGEAAYYPVMFQQCRDGKLEAKGGGGALIGLYRTDWLSVGGFTPARSPWGGDRGGKGAEDIYFGRRLEELQLKTNRPREEDLFCRWHKRFLSNPFYRTLRNRRCNFVPWMNVFRDDGTEVVTK